jgi:hypothetical protein
MRRPDTCAINPNPEVASNLVTDSFVFARDPSLRVRSIQNDEKALVILSDSEESPFQLWNPELMRLLIYPKSPLAVFVLACGSIVASKVLEMANRNFSQKRLRKI